ncbi:MAG: PAS domain S-box protein, partial [Limisphaerales bacterium]
MNDKLNILIAGNQQAEVDVIASLLTSLNENIIHCIGAQKITEYIESYEIALIILDKSFISQEGIKLIETIRQNKNSQSTPLLILGGEIMDDDFILSLNGFHNIDVLPATINPSILRSKVLTYLEIIRYNKQLQEQLVSFPKQDNILVLYGAPDILLSLQRATEQENIVVVGANTPQAAIELLSKYDFSVMFLDARLPKFDVIGFYRFLKAQEKYHHIQIILLSDIRYFKEDSLIASEIGAADIIMMPTPAEILKTKILLYLTHARDLRILAEKLSEIQKLNDELIHSRNELKELNLTLQDRVNEKTSLLQKAVEELRRQNEQLLLSEERFRLIVEGTNLGIFLTDPLDNIVFCNTRLKQMLNCSQETINNKNPIELFGENNKDDLLEILADRSKDVFRNKEIQVIKNDGQILWFSVTISSIYDLNGNFYGHCGILSDITERKLYEEKIRNQAELLDSASDAILLISLDGSIKYCNRSVENILNINPVDSVGKILTEIAPIIPITEFNSIVASLLKTGEYDKEFTYKLPDGKDATIFSRWKIIERQEGKSILIIATDITDKKEYEKQLFHTARLESIGALAAGMAHDLNNILAPIVMSASMLLEDEKDPVRRKLLDSIEKSATRGANVVKQVLTFAKKLPGNRITINPKHILREILSIAQETFPKNISIESSIPTNLWVINADPTQIHQVFLNLIINARDAMPDGGKLSILAKNVLIDEMMSATMPDSKPGNYVQVSVIDTGVGIPESIMDKIFEPFFTTKPKEIGTGLGLSTALGIVKSHNGFIRVKSKEGKGSTFEVWLPATPEATEIKLESKEIYDGNGETILVVDDEEKVLEITKSVLERHGYKVIAAPNG